MNSNSKLQNIHFIPLLILAMLVKWVFPERRRLTQTYLGVLQELAAHHLANQAPQIAVDYIEKAIPLDKLNEDLYCEGMRAYAALNNRTNLSRLFSDLNKLLKNELDAAPLQETIQLYEELIGGN